MSDDTRFFNFKYACLVTFYVNMITLQKQQDCVVTMFHYTAWADHGVAYPLSLVVFHRQVMKATDKSTGKYTLVHCR